LNAIQTTHGPTVDELKTEFHRLCRTWGWKTEEEVHVTMTDLGLGFRDVIKHLHDEAIVERMVFTTGAHGRRLVSQSTAERTVLKSLALKREAMRCVSLKSLGAGDRPTKRREESEAKQVLGRLPREGAVIGGVMEETEKWAQERFTGDPLISSFAKLRANEKCSGPEAVGSALRLGL